MSSFCLIFQIQIHIVCFKQTELSNILNELTSTGTMRTYLLDGVINHTEILQTIDQITYRSGRIHAVEYAVNNSQTLQK